MNLYELKLVKLPNGKKRLVHIKETDIYEDSRLYDNVFDMQITIDIKAEAKQVIIDLFEIFEGFSKKVREYCIYSTKEYFKR
jgi:predicted DNA-binding antitoxin AbrB/MazE fold protein